ncbi:MAG: ABC transporter transmembrane domain-containing protein, partial [Stackebrandtia sp.]
MDRAFLHDPGTPNTRGPVRYLLWLVGRQPVRVCAGAALSTTSITAMAVAPFFISGAVDEGLIPRDWVALAWWSAGVVAVGWFAAGGIVVQHRTMTMVRLDASYRTAAVTTRHIADLGATLPRRVSTGEVVNVGGADVAAVGESMSVVGGGLGSAAAIAIMGVLLLSVSPMLGAVVLVGAPLTVLAVGPLLRRLQRRETVYREHQGELTAKAGDIVSGLRVLRGVGGERRFAEGYRDRSALLLREGYRVGAVTSWVKALAAGLPGLFVAVVVWLAARLVVQDVITVGEMVAVYGYVAMLATPVYFLIEGAQDVNRGLVAARRVIRVLNLRPTLRDSAGTPCPARPAELHDPASGLTVYPGELLAVAAARPADALAVADRLGRYVDSAATWG